jgi:hypothetical protein
MRLGNGGNKMRDKSLEIFLMALFGIGGTTILIMAWAQPMPVSQRIMTTFVGSIGLFWVLIRVLMLRLAPANLGVDKVTAEVEAGKKPEY